MMRTAFGANQRRASTTVNAWQLAKHVTPSRSRSHAVGVRCQGARDASLVAHTK